MMHGRRSVLALAASTGLAARATAADSGPWEVLRAGGIVLFRHASAPGIGDPEGFALGDCATQRNLSAGGRAQAARIGERVRAEGVTVGAVLASQWCRTMDTAEIAFPGRVRGEPAFNSFFADRGDQARATAQARAILDAWRGPGALVVVTHQVNITALTGVVPSDGEGVVLPVPSAGRAVVGRVSAER